MCIKYKATHSDVFALPKRRSSVGKYLIILFGEKVLFELAEKLMLLEEAMEAEGNSPRSLGFSPPLVQLGYSIQLMTK